MCMIPSLLLSAEDFHCQDRSSTWKYFFGTTLQRLFSDQECHYNSDIHEHSVLQLLQQAAILYFPMEADRTADTKDLSHRPRSCASVQFVSASARIILYGVGPFSRFNFHIVYSYYKPQSLKVRCVVISMFFIDPCHDRD